MANLTRADVLIRLRKVICCVSRLAYDMVLGYANGIIPPKCNTRKLQLTTAIVEALRCYEPPIAETLAEGSFTLTGTAGGVTIYINAIDVTNGAIAFDTDLTTTATAVAAAITAFGSTPNYTATSSGAIVTVVADTGSGSSSNDFSIDSVDTGDMALTSVVDMTGGVDEIVDADNCFTLASAKLLFSELEELTGIMFAPAGATYIDPVAMAQQTEDIWDETGDTVDDETGEPLESEYTLDTSYQQDIKQ